MLMHSQIDGDIFIFLVLLAEEGFGGLILA